MLWRFFLPSFCFFLLPSFTFYCSQLYCFSLCHFCLCLSLCLPLRHSSFLSFVRADITANLRQVGRLHKVTWNTRWEKKCRGDNSLQPLRYGMWHLESCHMKRRTHSAKFACRMQTFWLGWRFIPTVKPLVSWAEFNYCMWYSRANWLVKCYYTVYTTTSLSNLSLPDSAACLWRETSPMLLQIHVTRDSSPLSFKPHSYMVSASLMSRSSGAHCRCLTALD